MPCVWTDFITGVLACGRSRDIRGNGHALVFPSFLQAVPLSPCQGVCWFSLPSSLLHCYLTRSPLKFHLFHEVLQPTGFSSSISFSQQPEARLNHSRICSCECMCPPSLRKERNSSGHLTFPLDPHWGDPGLGRWGCTKWLIGKSSRR